MNGTIAAGTMFPPAIQDQAWDLATVNAYAADVAQHLFQPAGVSGPTLNHPNPDALAYEFPAGAGWNSGDLTTESGGAGWHMSVDDLLNVMGCFRRQGTIMSPAAAQAMLDDGFGIDLTQSTDLGTLYNKNGPARARPSRARSTSCRATWSSSCWPTRRSAIPASSSAMS